MHDMPDQPPVPRGSDAIVDTICGVAARLEDVAEQQASTLRACAMALRIAINDPSVPWPSEADSAAADPNDE